MLRLAALFVSFALAACSEGLSDITPASDSSAAGNVKESPSSSVPALRAATRNREILLDWSPVSGASSYRIYKSETAGTGKGGTPIAVASAPYRDTAVENGKQYFYLIAAVDPRGADGEASNEVSATPASNCAGGIQPGGPVDGKFVGTIIGASSGDKFGWSNGGGVDLDGDKVNDFVSGAPGAQVGGKAQAGSAYVCSGSDGSLIFRFDGYETAGVFGTFVAVSDLGILVGAPGEGGGAGRLYLFSSTDGRLIFSVTGGSGDALGRVAAVVNGNIAIGAPQNSRVLFVSGSDGALIWEKSDEGGFGSCMVALTDINGDGRKDLAVSSATILEGRGKVWLLSGSDGALLKSFEGKNDFGADQLGFSIAASPDTLIVGAPGPTPAQNDFSSVTRGGRVYLLPLDTVLSVADLPQPVSRSEEYGDNFGYSVAGFQSGLNVWKFAVGAPGAKDADNVPRSGKIWTGEIAGASATPKQSGSGGELLGHSFTTLSGIDPGRLIAGAPLYKEPDDQAGRGRVFILAD